MDGNDAMKLLVPTAAFAVGVGLLLYFWPRPPKVFLTRERKRVQVSDVVELSHDTKRIRLSFGSKKMILGLPVGKHIVIYAPNPPSAISSKSWNGKPDQDKGKPEIDRKYTPVTGNEAPGYVDLVVKIYRPGTVKMPDGKEMKWEDGGKMGLYLDSKKPGDWIEIAGPLGVNEYLGQGTFKLPGKTVTVKHIGMLAGGTGLTPMLQVVQAALRDASDSCNFYLIYANKTENDILCRDMLDDLARNSKGRFKLYYTLDFPPENWAHKTGFITADIQTATRRQEAGPASMNKIPRGRIPASDAAAEGSIISVPETDCIPIPNFGASKDRNGGSAAQSDSTDARTSAPSSLRVTGEASSSQPQGDAHTARTPRSEDDKATDADTSSSSAAEDREAAFLLGPSEFPSKLVFSASRLPGVGWNSFDTRVEGFSSQRQVALSDVLRLNQGLEGQQLSFGSALHMGDGVDPLCLVCSYHKPPRRFCTKGAFCDFCHLHSGRRKKKPKAQASQAWPPDVPVAYGLQRPPQPELSHRTAEWLSPGLISTIGAQKKPMVTF
ncbi:CYB5R1 [Symbiodinium sp. CCMP2456]|nr:CYB5R1 [Symbiodinium sp. CCMP2456]